MASNGLKSIPNPGRLDIESILLRADMDNKLVTIASDLDGIGYVTDRQDFVIMTKQNGCIRLDRGTMAVMLVEALEILKEWQ